MIRNSVVFLGMVLGAISFATPARAQLREGVVVHGQWTLEVTDRDGRVVDRREFENALQGGQFVLAQLLTRRFSIGPTDVFLGDPDGVVATIGLTQGAVMQDTTSPFDDGRSATTSSVETSTGFSFPDIGVFQADIKAVRTGTVKSVLTLIWMCQPAGIDCTRTTPGAAPYAFTQTYVKNQQNVATPLTLEPEQTVHVTVRFTFTSPAS